MARQKCPIKYIGTLGDIRHFKIKNTDDYFADMIGRFNKKTTFGSMCCADMQQFNYMLHRIGSFAFFEIV